MFNAKLFIEDLSRALFSKDWSVVEEIIHQLNEYLANNPNWMDDDQNGHSDPDIEVVEEGEE